MGWGEGVVSISCLGLAPLLQGSVTFRFLLRRLLAAPSACPVLSPLRRGITSSPGICQSERRSVQAPSPSKLASKCFVSSPRCRCKFSPLLFNHGGFSEVHPFTFLMCSTLLFSADTFVNNSFLHLPPSFNLDYFLVS